MGKKYPHNDSNTITILIFFLPMRKAAYKSYRMKFSENLKMQEVLWRVGLGDRKYSNKNHYTHGMSP